MPQGIEAFAAFLRLFFCLFGMMIALLMRNKVWLCLLTAWHEDQILTDNRTVNDRERNRKEGMDPDPYTRVWEKKWTGRSCIV